MAKVREKKRVRKINVARQRRLPHGPRGGIELLLIQSIDGLGSQGDVVEVKPGFAKNYLLPQGLATLATDHHKRMVEKHRARLQSIEEQRVAKLRTLASSLSEQSLTIEANANDEGHLYGSVGAVEIVSALKRIDFTISEDQVRLEGPLKELGLYTVKIHLGKEVESAVKVWIVPTVEEEGSAK
ncbi:MAG: 50S ribosomal protein L9 [Planctomycetaceae bacterium]|nr:50S ribosomal protein L9 [Planctomycetaceae bacterium]|tara:strand:- start:1697 stop:2248 length:552 start_codon:yes stop_codon:yes gene_type:complete